MQPFSQGNKTQSPAQALPIVSLNSKDNGADLQTIVRPQMYELTTAIELSEPSPEHGSIQEAVGASPPENDECYGASTARSLLSANETVPDSRWYMEFAPTHETLAKAILARNKNELIFVFDEQEWFRYDQRNHHWSPCCNQEMGGIYLDELAFSRTDVQKATDLSDFGKDVALTLINSLGKNGFKNGTIDMMASVDFQRFSSDSFDANGMFVGLDDGTGIDLAECKTRDIEPQDYVTKSLGTCYDQNAKCPTWLGCINQWTCGDADFAKYLQTLAGYFLSGDNSDQKFYVLYGKGKNGKSVFMATLLKLLGDYATTIDPKTLRKSNRSGSSASPDITHMMDRRLISCGEVGEKGLDEELMKRLTGGEEINTRTLYQGNVVFTPRCKIVLTTNERPQIKGKDDGIWRRIAPIPFNAVIANADPYLQSKLYAELPGILNWAFEGWQEFSKEKALVLPNVIVQAQKDYFDEMNLIKRWMDECLEESPGNNHSATDLVNSYNKWAESNGYAKTNTKVFKTESQAYIKQLPRSSQGSRYTGFKIR